MLVIICKIHTLKEENRSKKEVYKEYSNKLGIFKTL